MQTATSRRVLSLAVSLVLFTGHSKTQVTPTIQVVGIPTYGTIPGWLSGRVLGVTPAAYNVTALVFISGLGFYTKPYCDATTTPLASDGSFNVLLTTGGIDEYATLIAILVVPVSSSVPCYAAEPGVPAALEQQAVAETLVSRPNPNQREIQFAGETWVVKSVPAPVFPGPNYFSDSQENVWVDNLGRLHLRITSRGGQWYCAEIVSKRVIGYGRYTVEIDTPPQFDKNVVFGAFSWADAERISREVDMLELGRFGNANDPNNAQNVVQPSTTLGNQMRFSLPLITPTVHTMTWLPGTLNFQSSDQFGGLLHQWAYGGQPPTTDSDRLNFRLNMWLVAPPSDGNEAEIVISNFSFVPAPQAISTNPAGGSGANQTFTSTFSDPSGLQDLRWAEMLFAVAPDGGGQSYCLIHYDLHGNALWLYGDGGFFVGPITPGTPSSVLQNSLCALNTSASTVSVNGMMLTVNASVVFKATGPRNIYLRAQNLEGVDTGWVKEGTWTPAAAPPGTMTVSPHSGSSTNGVQQTFTLTYPDPLGFAGAAFGWDQFLVAAASDGGGQPFCFVHYDRAGNGLWMYSSDVGFFLGPVAPGTASSLLQSSACSVNTAGTTVTNTRGNLVLTVPITLKPPMTGAKEMFQRTLDMLSQDTGFVLSGSWTIQ